MGNSPSSRRVTVVNDDVIGVVQVTESVVRKLRGEPEKPVQEASKTSTGEFQPPISDRSGFVPNSPTEPISSTLELRQKFQDEYRKAEKSWHSRIRELEVQNRQLFSALNDKTSATLTEIETNYVQNTHAPVCPDKQQKVVECCQNNSKFPLKCSNEVQDFIDCVDKARMSALVK